MFRRCCKYVAFRLPSWFPCRLSSFLISPHCKWLLPHLSGSPVRDSRAESVHIYIYIYCYSYMLFIYLSLSIYIYIYVLIHINARFCH